jgi:hypothetical protein
MIDSRIYIASKTKHAHKWRALRDAGEKIVSTWIDEAGQNETKDFADLWIRCITEAKTATALVAYIEEGEVLKGGLIEIGAALGADVPIFTVGPMPGTFLAHPSVHVCKSLLDAFNQASLTSGDIK